MYTVPLLYTLYEVARSVRLPNLPTVFIYVPFTGSSSASVRPILLSFCDVFDVILHSSWYFVYSVHATIASL